MKYPASLRLSTAIACLLLCSGLDSAASTTSPDPFEKPWAYHILGGYELVSKTNSTETANCPSTLNFTSGGLPLEVVRSSRVVRAQIERDQAPFPPLVSLTHSRRTSLTSNEETNGTSAPDQSEIAHKSIFADGEVCGDSSGDSYLMLLDVDLGAELSQNCNLIYGEDRPFFTRTCGNDTQVAVTMFTDCLPIFMDELIRRGQANSFSSSNGTMYLGTYNYVAEGIEPYGCWYARTADGPAVPSVSPVPSATPTESATPSTEPIWQNGTFVDDEPGESACFPASGRVRLRGGDVKRMDELVVGDKVQVGRDEYSPIFAFTHRDAEVMHSFLRFAIGSGEKEFLTLTKTHYLYVNGDLRKASSVQIGDAVVLADGSPQLVTGIEELHGIRGLFNPQTLNGNIVVDNVLTSTYTARVEPNLAHAGLSILRLAYRLGAGDVTRGMLEQISSLERLTF